MNLANAEILHVLASLFTTYGSKEVMISGDKGVIELYGTEERDVKCSADLNFPAVWKGSKGVQIRLTKT